MAATSHGTPARVQCRRSSLTSVYGMLRHRDEGDSLIVGAGIDPSAAAACTPQGIAEVQALADRTTSEQLRSGSGDGSGPTVQVDAAELNFFQTEEPLAPLANPHRVADGVPVRASSPRGDVCGFRARARVRQRQTGVPASGARLGDLRARRVRGVGGAGARVRGGELSGAEGEVGARHA